MKNSLIKIKTVSLLLALAMSTTMLTGCNKKKADNDITIVSNIETTAESTTAAQSETETETTTVAEVVTQAAKKPTKNKSVGSSSKIGNAKSTKDLANVDPKKAAKESYGTDVEVEKTSVEEISTEEYPYLKYADFSSHIEGVWKKFQAVDKVKIDAAYFNEYLNYITLHLKDTFFAINCYGYDATYAYDDSGKYIFLQMEWVYYIDQSKYNTCVNKANAIANQATGSTVEKIKYVHDYIAGHTKYKTNVDGAYNCLVNGSCDCDGYTAAFKLCMDKLGIPCKAFTTDSHIFNVVKVDGKWYVVDVTWDDQDSLGLVITQYFMRGVTNYKNFDVLVSLPLATSDYKCSRKMYISNDATFRKACSIKDSWTYETDDDGITIHIYDGGQLIGNLTLS